MSTADQVKHALRNFAFGLRLWRRKGYQVLPTEPGPKSEFADYLAYLDGLKGLSVVLFALSAYFNAVGYNQAFGVGFGAIFWVLVSTFGE
jgi:hypothetical protein